MGGEEEVGGDGNNGNVCRSRRRTFPKEDSRSYSTGGGPHFMSVLLRIVDVFPSPLLDVPCSLYPCYANSSTYECA